MNWIIKNTSKIEFHTNLKEILKPINNYIANYNWILCDLDFISDGTIPIIFGEDYYILSPQDFNKITQSHTQIIWGVISAIPFGDKINLNPNNLPFVEGNDNIWLNGNFQIGNSEIEIIAFDSSYTIVKFKDKNLSRLFKEYFEEAIELEKFK